jgi:hypothetical protein
MARKVAKGVDFVAFNVYIHGFAHCRLWCGVALARLSAFEQQR